MKIHSDIDQGSVQWLQLRAGKITASCLDQLLTPEFKLRTGQMPRTYMNTLLAEKWLGAPLPQPQGAWNLEQGSLLEDFGIPAFCLETGLDVQRVGFCENDEGTFGCSPDALVGDGAGLELKCPHLPTHISYLLDGELPPQYRCQVHGSMAVTGFSKWYFCSFRRCLPPLILTIERDETIQSAIREAVSLFSVRMDASWQTLCDLNGGEPPKPQRFVPSSPDKPKFSWQTDVLTP